MTLDRQVEEILEALWTTRNEHKQARRGSLFKTHPPHPFLDSHEMEAALRAAEQADLLQVRGEILALTEKGLAQAQIVVRRHRLAERLLNDVLDMGVEEAESSACRFEHLLSPEATNSVCILLGHPSTCPHGKPIPEGPCCQRQLEEARPLVIPATQLRQGEIATVAYLASHGKERLNRMTSLGILPGARVELIQRHPAHMLRFGETTLALDKAIVREIYVRRNFPEMEPANRRRGLLRWRKGSP